MTDKLQLRLPSPEMIDSLIDLSFTYGNNFETYHKITVSSLEPEARILPFGENATVNT